MRKLLILFLLCLLPLFGYSQKVNVGIIRTKDAALSEWQILDENYRQVIQENEYPDADSVVFSLEAGRRYFLQVSITDILKPGIPLYTLLLDNEYILSAGSETEPGDYFYPFFAGTRESQTKIIGGSDASISDFPWQIYLIAGNYQCGGSIISPGWVVTAAHCVKTTSGSTIPASSMTITAGSGTPTTSGTKYYVNEVIPNPSYSSTTLENDIALLKVSNTISCTDCKPVKLMNAKNVAAGFTNPGKNVWVTGWGITDVLSETIPYILQAAQMPIVSNSVAASVWGTIPSTDIMAGYLNGNKDACSGDSGGPMSVYVDGEYKLAGIVSWGSKKCNTYGAYSKVSSFETWIRNITGIYDYTSAVPVGDSVVCQGTVTSDYTEELVSNALSYEWQLIPSNAGTISWNREKATVIWNQGYTGSVTVRARVKLSDSYSEWGERSVTRALITKLISQPGDTAICTGNPLKLSLETEGTSLYYEWYKNSSLFSSGISNSLSWISTPESVTGEYRCQVRGMCGTLSTNVMNVIVYPVTVINSISPDVTADYGSDITLQVDAGGHDLEYQWIKNGKPVINNNSSQLFLQNVDARNIGIYNTVVKGTCGTLVSDSLYVYLKQTDVTVVPEVSVWPTVITDEVNVATENSGKYDVRIFNLSGKLMLSSLSHQYKTTFNIGNYPKGIYILNVRSDKFIKSFKLIRE
jgi:secreted trypsin-like serine protease